MKIDWINTDIDERTEEFLMYNKWLTDKAIQIFGISPSEIGRVEIQSDWERIVQHFRNVFSRDFAY